MKNNLSLITLIGILLFALNSIGQPYCSSTYQFYFQNYISNVNFNTIANTSGPTGYSDFTSINTEIGLGVQYDLTVTIVNFNATTMYVVAWIDWNQDFDFFDAGEAFNVGTVVGPTFGTDVTVSITVPGGATLGPTRLRISTARGFLPTPCNSGGYLYGETEDYSVIVGSSPFYWDGELNTNWDNPLNWNLDVIPTVNDPVIIPGGAPRYPIVGNLSVGELYSPFNCKSMIVENGASVSLPFGQISIYDNVTVKSGGLLSVNRLIVGYGGSVTISGGTVSSTQFSIFQLGSHGSMSAGTFSVGNNLEFQSNSSWNAFGGTIRCKSGVNTEIINNSSNNVTFNNLLIESGAIAQISGDSDNEILLTGNVTIQEGAQFTLEAPTAGGNISEIIISGNFNINGSNSGKGSFIDEDGSDFITYGTTNVGSYYTDNRWHFISSPVTSAVSGIFLDLYLKAFDEPTNSYTPSPGITSTTYPLGIGQGFEIWSDIGNPTITYTGGQLNTGYPSSAFTATDSNSDFTIGDGEGWNLMGNPYPSAIDFGTENDPVSGYTWVNIDSTIYAWNGTNWSSFNMAGDGTGVNGGTRYLPSMQGFFLKANDFSPSFGFSNAARLHNAQANYKSAVNKDFEIKLIVNGNDYSDEMIVRAIDNASVSFDSKYDAYKLPGMDEVPQLYSMAGASRLSINTLPEFNEELVIPVYVKVGKEGIYEITANDFDLSKLGLNAYLEDLKEGSIFRIDENTTYGFSSEPIDVEHRFNLLFKKAVNDYLIPSAAQIFSFDDIVIVRKEAGVNADIFIYDIMGREVNKTLNSVESEVQIQVSNGTGNYIVKLVTSNFTETKKVFIK